MMAFRKRILPEERCLRLDTDKTSFENTCLFLSKSARPEGIIRAWISSNINQGRLEFSNFSPDIYDKREYTVFIFKG